MSAQPNKNIRQSNFMRVKKMYRADNIFFFGVSLLSMFVGVKVCDYFFYDEKKLLIQREQMEEEYWKLHGQPKYLKPEIVESLLKPGEMRKSWIKIVYGKDKYIPRQEIKK